MRQLRVAGAHLALAAVVIAGATIAVRISENDGSFVPGAGTNPPPWIAGTFDQLLEPTRLTNVSFYALVALMGVAYFIVVALRQELRLLWLVGAVVLLHVAFVLAPPILSRDVWLYIDVARLAALHGIDPWTHGPAAALRDPAFIHAAWRHSPSAYGPLFTLGSYPLAHVSLAVALWTFKAVAALASLACITLVWALARRFGRPPAGAVAVFGLNPLLLVWTVGGAHNDLLMLALLLAGIWLLANVREAIGGGALVAAAAMKATAGVALPIVLIATARRGRLLAGVAAAALAILAISWIVLPGDPLGFIQVLPKQEHLATYHSVPRTIGGLFGLKHVTPVVRAMATALATSALVLIAVRVWRGADWIAGCGWALVVLVAAATHLLPWYTVWPLPLAAVVASRSLLAVTLGLEAFFVIAHLPGVST